MRPHTLFVGTSPLMLMQALKHAEAGDNVTIIDQADIIGGAWATPPLVGLDRVECGVHLLENRPSFYAALRRLGIVLEREESNMTLWRSHRLSMAPSRALFHTLVAVNAARRGQLDRAVRVAASAIRSLRNLGTQFEYPTAGCYALHRRLSDELCRHGVAPILNARIERIEISTQDVQCKTSLGTIVADRIVIGSRAHAPLFIRSREVEANYEQDRIASLILRGVEPGRPPGGYVELLRDRYLKRVRDITRYCNPLVPDGEFVLCVQLRGAGENRYATGDVDIIADHLIALGIVSRRARVVDHAMRVYVHRTITDFSLRAIERQGFGRVRALRTTDFANAFQPSGRPAGYEPKLSARSRPAT